MSSEPIVTATDLHRRYGEGDAAVDALDGVTVEFDRGRFTAIMGPSGSGKSTLMHILAGPRPADRRARWWSTAPSSPTLDDADLTELRRDKLGFVFQFFNLLPVLTAEENIVLPLSIAGRKPDPEWLEPADRRRRPRRPPHPPPGRALGRPAAARGGGPRAGLQARGGVRRRAHRQPRLDGLGRGAAPAAPRRRRLRPDRGHGHPRRHAAAYADRLVVLGDGKVVHDGAAGTEDDVLALMHDAG